MDPNVQHGLFAKPWGDVWMCNGPTLSSNFLNRFLFGLFLTVQKLFVTSLCTNVDITIAFCRHHRTQFTRLAVELDWKHVL